MWLRNRRPRMAVRDFKVQSGLKSLGAVLPFPMKITRFTLTSAFALFAVYGQTVDIGSGAPNEAIRQRFVNAYSRGFFSGMVSLPPIADVKKLGTTGYVQEFNDANKTSGVKLAIVKANLSTAVADGEYDTFQMHALLYAYFNTVGVSTVGYPTRDTAACVSVQGSCTYQTFDKKYALFAFTSALASGQNFSVRDPFFSYWLSQSGISIFGPAVSAETAVTSTGGSVSTAQYFDNGVMFNVTAGPYTGKFLTVRQPVYSTYSQNGGPTGTLGMPVTDVLTQSNGNRRQNFEKGWIEIDPNNGVTVRLPVNAITLTPNTTSIRLNLNDTYKLTATIKASNGDLITDRVLNWTSTNGRVVTIQTDGYNATLKAVGGGVAQVNATSEGTLSQQITVFVSAPCCQVGEGAPSSTLSQNFVDSVSRNKLNLKLPTAAPVRRAGLGYLQEFTTADTGARLVLALPDRSAQAYVVSGPVLGAWESLGSTAGTIGYPSSDATPAGRQLFEGGALAGSPVRLVSGSILSKWAILGYETGAAGPPVAEAVSYFTFAATSGVRQVFKNGSLYLSQNGAGSGRVVFTTGLINALFETQGGAAGKFGAPVNDELTISGIRRQDFEGGYMQYSPGDQVAKAFENARKPNVQASPATVVAGSRVRLAIGGFAAGATLRVTVAGQSDFLVRTDTGAYTWEAFVPSNATTATIRIHVVDTASATTVADGLYNVKAAADAKLILSKASGDGQTSLPGSVLPLPLRVVLKDDSGNPLSGVAVSFRASPGASISPATANTDATGSAAAFLRLPSGEGTALATAQALGQIVTFSARSIPSVLTGLVKQTTTGDPIYAGAAMLLKFYQDRGDLTTVNGVATASLVENYLKGFCAVDASGSDLCDGLIAVSANSSAPNPWRLANLVAGNLEVSGVAPNLNAIRDQLGQGNPLLITLALPGGAYHSVVATGLASDGGVTILDPNAAYNRTNLNEYLNGFSAGGVAVKATLAGALRMLPRTPVAPGFLVISTASTVIASPAGTCGDSFNIPSPAGTVRFSYCEGSQSLYQLDLSATADYQGFVVDLGTPTSRTELNGIKAGSFRVARPGTQWEASPLEASFKTESVVSAASFTAEIAPGGLVSIFGVGLAKDGGKTTVTVSGVDAPVLNATPFQLNAQIPLELPAGSHLLQVKSPFGQGESQISLLENAPAIFRLGTRQGAIVNQDGSINSSSTPARRGQAIVIYATGLGAVVPSGNLKTTSRPVTVVVGSTAIIPFFAGLTPGFVGLYQVNATLPAAMPPGLDMPLSLRQGGAVSLPVDVSLQ